jgi:hypothetical protein
LGLENSPDSEATKQNYGNEEKKPEGKFLVFRSHLFHILLIFFIVGVLDGLNRAFLRASREEFQMMGDFFLARFRQDFNINALLFARKHWQFFVVLKYFLRDAMFLAPAVIIRFLFIRKPLIVNPPGCVFSVIFALVAIVSVLSVSYYEVPGRISFCLVIFGWYQILMIRKKYQGLS